MYGSNDWCAAAPLAVIRDTVHLTDSVTLFGIIGNGVLDAIVTDPPYGVGPQVSQHNDRENRLAEIVGASHVDATWIAPAVASLKDGGALYMFAKWTNIAVWEAHVRDAGLTIRNWIVWDKGQHGGGDIVGAYAPQHEFILFASKGKHELRGPRLPDVIRVMKVHPSRLVHPYEKPVALLQKFITASTDVGGWVCDPFCGSGPTLYGAKELGRHYIGCDVDPFAIGLTETRLTGARVFEAQTNPTKPMFASAEVG